ncbi:predicted protein [Chaetomium globosum CBS 148.51]|uniref:Non-canonical purine NTP phosphatase/PRRC1 domain-containing protein n=1 Tax=Chaetomium globosum (strain ATCC 6205 / CBS 148.51 / DSM 1962 / NBRC 6347 / NRRL 1970) TaxID=306901 RepID=Q2HEM8_CHAGB|nr:uncharacterized protein CHGG_01326 [Chaetomium globosum CBS 148.51]EAQ93091.1 predicted protein [Chaetomium globosum CBS 148.51]
MSHIPTTTPASAAAAPKPTNPNPDTKPTNPLYNPTLPTDRSLFRQPLRPAPDATALCAPYIPSPSTLPTLTTTTTRPPNPNNVLLLIPTANASKTALLTAHLAATRPPHITSLTHLQIPADSGVGEQPYDGAGPRGAFNRVVGAVHALQRQAERGTYGEVLSGVGTVVVGAVENFVRRERAAGEGGVLVPVDYGVVVFCRVSLAPGEERARWEWRVGVSKGVMVPREYWRAAEGFGFEDDERMHGKVTVGEVLAANLGVDKADWFLSLMGVSRYDLLRDAMEEMEVPWPAAGNAPVAVSKAFGA